MQHATSQRVSFTTEYTLPALGSMASGKLTPAKRERELWPPAENSEEFQYVFTGNKEAPHGVNADSVKQLQGRLEESRPCVKWQTALGAYLAGLKVIMRPIFSGVPSVGV